MTIRDGKTMSNMEKDTHSQRLARITKYMEIAQERGEQAVDKYLDDWLERVQKDFFNDSAIVAVEAVESLCG